MIDHPLTYGEKTAGVKLNPSVINDKDVLKHHVAQIIDMMAAIYADKTVNEDRRYAAYSAMEKAKSALSWAERAVHED